MNGWARLGEPRDWAPGSRWPSWEEDYLDGEHILVTDEMLEAATLISVLYNDWPTPDSSGYCTGGPLHVQLDDHNLDDPFLRPGVEYWSKEVPESFALKGLTGLIRDSLSRLSESQRHVAVGIGTGVLNCWLEDASCEDNP